MIMAAVINVKKDIKVVSNYYIFVLYWLKFLHSNTTVIQRQLS